MGYWRNKEDERSLSRCAACDATVSVETWGGRADATVCPLCSTTVTDLAFESGDYFDVIMRVGRPMGRRARPREVAIRRGLQASENNIL